MQQQGIEALRQQADARAQQLSEILSEFADESANATAKALNERGLPGRGGNGRRARSSTCALASTEFTAPPATTGLRRDSSTGEVNDDSATLIGLTIARATSIAVAATNRPSPSKKRRRATPKKTKQLASKTGEAGAQ